MFVYLFQHGNVATSSETSVGTQPGGSVTSRAASDTTQSAPHSASSGSHTGAKFRHGLLQLMIHTIDPLHDGKLFHPTTNLHTYHLPPQLKYTLFIQSPCIHGMWNNLNTFYIHIRIGPLCCTRNLKSYNIFITDELQNKK